MEDLKAIVSDNMDTIMLPKARVSDIKLLNSILETIEKSLNMKKKIGIIPIIELAISVLEVEEIVKLPRVRVQIVSARFKSISIGNRFLEWI